MDLCRRLWDSHARVDEHVERRALSATRAMGKAHPLRLDFADGLFLAAPAGCLQIVEHEIKVFESRSSTISRRYGLNGMLLRVEEVDDSYASNGFAVSSCMLLDTFAGRGEGLRQD